MNKIYIGFVGDTTCNSNKTKEQIESLKEYTFNIFHNGEKINLDDIYKEGGKERIVLNKILADRKERVDNNTLMADRPPFAIFTVEDDVVVRFEYFEGHNSLKQIYDIRSKKLKQKILEPSYKK
ncbi:MAG: hypothetical protein ACOCV1_03430 [Bacillota bacterium]